MDQAAKNGHWVVLQNIHLVKKWLPVIKSKLAFKAGPIFRKKFMEFSGIGKENGILC